MKPFDERLYLVTWTRGKEHGVVCVCETVSQGAAIIRRRQAGSKVLNEYRVQPVPLRRRLKKQRRA